MPVDNNNNNSNEPSCCQQQQQQTQPRDPIIVLDVGGRRPFFKSHQSTLTMGSSYFASRFCDRNNNNNNNNSNIMQPGGFLGTDEFGQEIYFVDRDGELFRYVLEFLRNNTVDLPNYAENQPLWRSLRREAAFYGVEGLTELLQVTHSCRLSTPPDVCCTGDQGILYWLGTNRGRQSTYRNPFTIGAVNVHVEDMEEEDDDSIPQDLYEEYGQLTWRGLRKATFVQHRQKVNATGGGVGIGNTGLNSCDGEVGQQIVVDLQSIRARPTHYSIRYGDCFGMTADWEFAGSIDGNQWDVLHDAKTESYIERPCEGTLQDVQERLGLDRHYNPNTKLSAFQREQLTGWVERNCRRTWSVPNSKASGFYSLFRIRKVGVEGCLHGTSFEIFGDVNECIDE